LRRRDRCSLRPLVFVNDIAKIMQKDSSQQLLGHRLGAIIAPSPETP
jgi:hypothetical protein